MIKYKNIVSTLVYIHYASSAWREVQSEKVMDMTRCSLGKFLVVSTFATRCLHICKAGRDPSGERWNYLRRRLSLNFHKWQLSRHLSNCFRISEPLWVRNMYFVSVCSTYRLSLRCIRLDHDSCKVMKFVYMRKTCSVAMQNMWLKLELNLVKQLVFIIFSLYLLCWIWVRNIWLYKWSNTFNGVNTDVIDVCLETIHSLSVEIGIITKNF